MSQPSKPDGLIFYIDFCSRKQQKSHLILSEQIIIVYIGGNLKYLIILPLVISLGKLLHTEIINLLKLHKYD